jgi:hypothetical protein
MPVSISGTTGYAGPLGAITVDTGSIVNNAVTPAKMSRTGSSGQVLTSNGAGADPSYQALPSGGVTSLAAGNGIAVSASTGAVTVSQDIYTGTSDANTSYPIGSYVVGSIGGCCGTAQNTTLSPRAYNSGISYANGSSFLAGTWRIRGYTGGNQYMTQRVA